MSFRAFWLGMLGLLSFAGIAVGASTQTPDYQGAHLDIPSFNANTYQVVVGKTPDERPSFGSMVVGTRNYTGSSHYRLPVRTWINEGRLFAIEVDDWQIRVADADAGATSTGTFTCSEEGANAVIPEGDDDTTPEELFYGGFCELNLTLTKRDRAALSL